MPVLRQKLLGLWNNFTSDIRGAVLFYVTATLPVLIGFSLLAVDSSRLMTLHTSLQKGVDALAIAAAGELDRLPGAMNRSNLAVKWLVKNKQLFGDGALNIDNTNVTVRFFSALPADDSISMPANGDSTVLNPNIASDNFIARFVEVTVDTYSMSSIFPASFLGGVNQATTVATAVAGMDQTVCRLAPMFICNPWELSSNTNVRETASIINGTDTRADRRRMIRMRMGPGGDGYGPGNYGFLDMGNGATALERALAVGSAETCFVQDGVNTKPGQTTGPVENGINVRFGLYPNSMSNIGINGDPANSYAVRPAKNVRKGQDQGQAANKICTDYYPEAAPADGVALPRDPCIADNTCERIGNGNWGLTEMEEYWDANHPGQGNANMPSSTVVGPAITDPPYQTEVSANSWDDLTRYDIYKYEISQQALNDELGAGGESGNPALGASCYGGPSIAADPVDRRIIVGAILNCRALVTAGNNLNGNQTNVPVAAFAEFFITEPLEKGGSGTAGDIYSELVTVVFPGNSNSVARDQIQLYR